VTTPAPLLPDPCCPGHASAHLDRTGAPFLVCPYHTDARKALERFYLDFEPKRAAQGLPPSSPERIARWLDSVLPRGIHLLACRDKKLIGHALLIPTDEGGAAEYAIFLHQDVRGRGLGTELNRISIEAARAAGLRRIWLCVAPHNRAAIKSYERVGFRFLPGTIYSPEAEMQIEL
jgi:RimJ/RimL family protein N-acetyltransferase